MTPIVTIPAKGETTIAPVKAVKTKGERLSVIEVFGQRYVLDLKGVNKK